jgi:triacylglycerol lipase
VGPQTAYHTLDSIRATLNSQDITGLSSEANTILYGYSGGGLATEWATQFHPSYAPTLKVIGAAMGGLPTNIANTYRHVNNEPLSELNVLATLGLANAYSEVNRYVNKHLLPKYKKAFFYPRVRCGPHAGIDDQPALINMNITAMFDNGDDILADFKELIDEIGLMGQRISEDNTPNFPLYIWAGTNDDVVRQSQISVLWSTSSVPQGPRSYMFRGRFKAILLPCCQGGTGS